MSKVTNPVEKKALTYREDHREGSRYPHAFRRNFPRKRARANRKYRHGVREYLHINEQSIVEGAEMSDPPLRRDYVRSWGAMPLGEWVSYRVTSRRGRVAGKYFRARYDSARDKERFAAFLSEITANDSEEARAAARHLDNILHGRVRPLAGSASSVRPPFLLAFLADAPEWNAPLRTWIARVRADELP